MTQVDVYFDYRSPYAYFLSGSLPPLARRRGFKPRWQPVSIHILLNLQVGRDPWAAYEDPLPPVKRQYLMHDVVRRARFLGMPLTPPVALDSLAALRTSLRLGNGEEESQFRHNVWQAQWVEGKDIADLDVLADCAAHLGSAARTTVEGAQADASTRLLTERSRQAFAAGVFGVPSMVIGQQVLFGSDQLDVLEWIVGNNIERTTI